MKFQTTQKAIKENYYVYYGDLQYLLQYNKPMAYTAGVYGWNSDIYTFGNIAISVGYRPFGKKIDYTIINKYESKAKKIYYDDSLSFNEKKRKINQLLKRFVKELQEAK